VGNAWFVFPLNDDLRGVLGRDGVVVRPGTPDGVLPSPNQVFAVLESFPEYTVKTRRRDRGDKGEAVYIELHRSDGSYAIAVHLLGVRSDREPAGVFVFDYYRETEELVRIVSRLAALCGPLVLYHDSGGEPSVLVAPPTDAEPNGP
jgi:hypothetical protein